MTVVLPPDNEVPVQVLADLVLGRTGDIAIWMDELLVYSTCVALAVQGRSRSGSGVRPPNLGFSRPGSGPIVKLRIEFDDGTAVSNGERAASGTSGSALVWGGGSSSGEAVSGVYYLSPVPASGSFVIVAEHPAHQMGETRNRVECEVLRDASTRVRVLW